MTNNNSVNNVINTASNADRIIVTIPNRSFYQTVTLKELIMVASITDTFEVLCTFEHHSVEFIMDTNTIITNVRARS